MEWWALVGTLLMVMQMVQVTQCEKILFASPLSSKSHKNFYMGIINALADKGHQVTLVTPFQSPKEKRNVREVIVKEGDLSQVIPSYFEGAAKLGVEIFTIVPSMCVDALEPKQVQELRKEKFDLVILTMFFSDCYLSLIHQLNVPYIWTFPGALTNPSGGSLGNPSFPSFEGPMLINGRHPLSFFERAANTFSSILMEMLFLNYMPSKMETECRERGLCPEDMPSLPSMRNNANLCLVNSLKTIEYPVRPYVPGIIHCGGIHCRPAKPLPQDLEEWVQGAGDAGFIFFSLGSAVKPSSMPEQYRKILVEVLGSLKQRVLWKWDLDTMDDLPSNVRLGKWLPQQDILGDPRLRLFITHGGLLSTLESMYNGIPVLGIPVFADQHMNMLEVQAQGCGRFLLWNELTPESLRKAIYEVMADQRMREEAKRRSSVMKDQPMHPADVATYWVEYVMRHNGAPHLRSPLLDLPWYKLYNVDVWLSVAFVFVLITVVTFKLLRALCSSISSAKSKTKGE